MLVVGIDLGTQSCKAYVCDDGLRVRGSGAAPITTVHPRPGEAEQDPRAWERALAPAIGSALAAAGATAHDIAAIAVVGQLDGCVAVDDTGAPLHPALIWQDRRAVAEAARVDARELFAITGQVADAAHLAPKAVWLRARVPAVQRFHQPVSYLVERLTGVAVMDPALASTTMLAALATGMWSPRLLAAFAIDARALPAIRPATAIAAGLTRAGARLTGLRAGTPVAVGTGDDFATALGAGLAGPGGPVLASIGTAEVVAALAPTAVLDRATEPMVETHAFPAGAYIVENPGWLAGGAIRWATALLRLASDADLDALAAAAPPGADGVTFLPALGGAMTPVWRPHARGTLHGLAASHGPPHVARAVLEGLAFACRDVVDRLAELGLPTDQVLVTGGGSRSVTWTQLRADALGRPHAFTTIADTSALGAAMIAAVAAGLAPDLAVAARRLAPPRAVLAPGSPATCAALADAYGRYQRLSGHLAALAETPWV